ncbi:hypothetical protein FA95DRAFT_1506897, partial [Auriscalpium vulgare]
MLVPCPPITIQGNRIDSTASHKFLGVILDRQLRFHEHVAHALRKGTKWVNTFRRFTRPSRGISTRYMRQFYLAVAIPKMLYAADIFLIPTYSGMKGSKSAIARLARVQRQATISITGAMRNTATDLLDAHADIPPFHLIVDQKCYDAALRLATVPYTHPLHYHIDTA